MEPGLECGPHTAELSSEDKATSLSFVCLFNSMLGTNVLSKACLWHVLKMARGPTSNRYQIHFNKVDILKCYFLLECQCQLLHFK